MKSALQAYLEELHARLSTVRDGKLADYIPELTKANPDWFGICLVTMDGSVYSAGDADKRFTIQSVSKPFTYAAALADRGIDFVMQRVGVEPSGDAFNSISLDPRTGAPLNPMINAGAIATTSLVIGDDADAQWRRILGSHEAFVGHPLEVDEDVYRSESETGYRNRAIAWMLKNFGIIDGDPMPALENYFRQCSLLVDCQDLAFMAATLANGGVHPVTGVRALPPEHVNRVLSVMATCGMYDYAGSWLFEVGMPAKSGVGGGIIAVLPGRLGLGMYSPLLDGKGNSVRGINVCKLLSRDLGLHVFSRLGAPSRALSRVYTGADAPSRREPSPAMRAVLRDNAHRIKYLCLHGYIGVDGVEYVTRRMMEMAGEADSYILDMHQVTGISESAARLLNDTRLRFVQEGLAMVFSRIHGRPEVAGPLRRTAGKGDRGYLSFEDNDLAVEWCEDRLLGALSQWGEMRGSLADSVMFRGCKPELLASVEAITEVRHYIQGEEIITTGQTGDTRVFFIEKGHVSVLVPLGDGAHHRVATLAPGMNFGEMMLLGQTTRTATVVANTDVTCRILHAADIDKLAEEQPEVKIVLLQNLSRDMAEKLKRATQWIAALA